MVAWRGIKTKGKNNMNNYKTIKPIIDKSLKNYYKKGITDILVDLYNDFCDRYNDRDSMIYENNADNINMLLENSSPYAILTSIKNYKGYDAYIYFDGYGYLNSAHYDYLIDTLKDHTDFLEYVYNYVSIDTLDQLNKLADQETSKILQDAYNLGAK